MKTSRRIFMASGAALAAAPLSGGLTTAEAQQVGKTFELGLASYTMRQFDLETTVATARRLGLKHIALKSMHMPLDASPEELKRRAKLIADAGIDLYGCGVVYMKNEAEVENAFAYARTAGMRVIIGAPEPALLPQVEKQVKKTGIFLAIHNHGPGDDRWPTPESAYEKMKDMDPRMGLCIDIGHVTRLDRDPVESIYNLRDRVFDVHIKDVSRKDARGGTVEIGRGVIDIPAVLQALLDIGYTRYTSFEFEKDAKDPVPGLAESVGYVRGVLAVKCVPA